MPARARLGGEVGNFECVIDVIFASTRMLIATLYENTSFPQPSSCGYPLNMHRGV